jgi:hypothetical protein
MMKCQFVKELSVENSEWELLGQQLPAIILLRAQMERDQKMKELNLKDLSKNQGTALYRMFK